MGKDSLNNVLFALGVIGCLILAILFSYNIYLLLYALPYLLILDWVAVLALVLVALALIALYRETGSFLPLIAMILLLILQLLVTLLLLDILFPLLLTVWDMATANLYLSWLFWIFYLVIYLLIGYSFWLTRDDIGIIATLAGIIFMIWGILNLVLQFLTYGALPSILNQIWSVGVALVYFFGFLYFIMALRN
jgi:hypothetical protein